MAIINISVKLRLSQDTLHKVKRLVSSLPGGRAFSVVLKRSRTKRLAWLGVGDDNCGTIIVRMRTDEENICLMSMASIVILDTRMDEERICLTSMASTIQAIQEMKKHESLPAVPPLPLSTTLMSRITLALVYPENWPYFPISEQLLDQPDTLNHFSKGHQQSYWTAYSAVSRLRGTCAINALLSVK